MTQKRPRAYEVSAEQSAFLSAILSELPQEVKDANAARLRAWHVRMGHNVKDPTAEELAVIARVKAAAATPVK